MPDATENFATLSKLLKESGTEKIYNEKANALADKAKIKPADAVNILQKAGIAVIEYRASTPPLMDPMIASTIEQEFQNLRKGFPDGTGRDDKNTDLTQIRDLYDFAAYVDNLSKSDYKPETIPVKAAQYKKKSAAELEQIFITHETDKGGHTNYSNGWQKLCSLGKKQVFNNENNKKAYDNHPAYKALKKELMPYKELLTAFESTIPEVANKLIDKIESHGYTREESIALYNKTVEKSNLTYYIPAKAVSFVYISCRCGTVHRFGSLNESKSKNCSECGKPLYEQCLNPRCGKQTLASKDFCIHCEFFQTGAKMFDFYYRAAESELRVGWMNAELQLAHAKAANPYRETEISSLEKLIDDAKQEALQEQRRIEIEMARQKAIEEENKKAATLERMKNLQPEPCGDVAVEAKDNCVNISWGASTAEYIEYKLIKKENAAPSNPNDGFIIASGESLLHYSDRDIKLGVNYYYGVFTQRQGGGKTSEIKTKSAILLTRPLDVRYAESSGRLTITWRKPPNCTCVKIKIGKTNNDTNAHEIYNESGESYVDTNLKSGEKYAYGIVAVYNISGIERESDPYFFSFQLPSYEPCELQQAGILPDNSIIKFKILNRDILVANSADYINYNIKKNDEPLSSEDPVNHPQVQFNANSSEISFRNSMRGKNYLNGDCIVTAWVRYGGKEKFSPPFEIPIYIPLRK